MSTVISDYATRLGDSFSKQAAPNNLLRSTCEKVLTDLENNKQIVLITGAAKSGKTLLIQSICKDIAAKNRIITLSGKDLPAQDKSDNSQLNNIKDFILESTDIGDELVIVLDDAHIFPIDFLATLIERTKQSASNTHSLQLILSGPLDFRDQLLAIEHLQGKDLSHFPMDDLDIEKILTYTKDKSYKFSSDIKRLKFETESLQALADFIQSDQQVLDVVLEWCSALVKKDQLTNITPHTVNRAANFAQQFSKDKKLRLANSYPPSHEAYQYINNIQSTETKNKSTAPRTYKNLVNKRSKHKSLPQSKLNPRARETKIPTIIAKTSRPNESDTSIPKLDETSLRILHEDEDEIMPTQWTPSSKTNTANKNSFPAMAGLLTVLVLSFIAFIAFRIDSNPDADEIIKEQITSSELENTIANNPLVDDVQKPSAAPAEIIKEQNEVVVKESLQATEIVTIEPDKPTLITEITEITEKNEENPLLSTTEQNQNKLHDNISSEELIQEDQQALLTVKKDTNTMDDLSITNEIDELLVLASRQLENKNLTTPAGSNALETYQKILTTYPNNEAAIVGIKKVHDRYLNWANYYLQNNDIKRAKYFYLKALSIDPTDTFAITSLENIAREESAAKTELVNIQDSNALQTTTPLDSIANLFAIANQKMQQIKNDIGVNNRNYKVYQEAQTAYQSILKVEPSNHEARKGLLSLKNYYVDWAELQILNKNYNIALFLYGNALSIQPDNSQIAQRIEQIRELKNVL